MEKSVVLAFLVLVSLSFVSAQYYGSYSSGYGFGGFYLDDYLSGDFISYAIIFLIFFWFLQVILLRISVFQGGKQASIGAFLFATGITYGIYRSGWSVNGIFFSLGLPEGISSAILAIVFLAAIFFIVKKLHFYGLFLIGGAVLAGISYTDLVYDQTGVLAIGIVLFVIGLFSYWRKRKKDNSLPEGPSPSPIMGQIMNKKGIQRGEYERKRR